LTTSDGRKHLSTTSSSLAKLPQFEPRVIDPQQRQLLASQRLGLDAQHENLVSARILHGPRPLARDQTAGMNDPVLDHLAIDQHLADLAQLIADEDVVAGIDLQHDGRIIADARQSGLLEVRGPEDELAAGARGRQIRASRERLQLERCADRVEIAGAQLRIGLQQHP
jgi:hypothetical protein